MTKNYLKLDITKYTEEEIKKYDKLYIEAIINWCNYSVNLLLIYIMSMFFVRNSTYMAQNVIFFSTIAFIVTQSIYFGLQLLYIDTLKMEKVQKYETFIGMFGTYIVFQIMLFYMNIDAAILLICNVLPVLCVLTIICLIGYAIDHRIKKA